MDALIQDLRYAARRLRKSPGFTIVAVLTLALGIGANTAIFSAVEAVLLRPLPYPDADRIVLLRGEALSTANFREWQRQASSYDQFAAVSSGFVDLAGPAGPDRVGSMMVSEDFLPLFGLRPARGRTFLANDFRAGGGAVAIVTDRFWREKLDAAPDAVGSSLVLDRRSYTVVGVMPPGIGPLPYQHADIWLPLDPAARAQGTGVLARLKHGVALRAARAEAEMIARRLIPSRASVRDTPVGLDSFKDSVVGSSRLTLLVLFGAVAFVLMIGCLNVANLLLARATSRSREIAVRSALGAGRGRIVQQLFAESLLLAAAGAALGLLLAQWVLTLLLSLLPYPVPGMAQAGVDGTVVVFAVGLSLVAAVGFGLTPALVASRTDLSGTLKEGSRQVASGRRQRRLRNALVVAEVALALVMLVGAGLLIRTFLILDPAHPGFEPRNKLVVRLAAPAARFRDPAGASRLLDVIVDRASALPGVRAVAAVTDLPFTGNSWLPDVSIGGRQVAGRALETWVFGRASTPDYFRVMGMPMVGGRDFLPSDDERAPRVAILNQDMARRFWPGGSALGQQLGITEGGTPLDFTVVGVVRDERISGEETASQPELYVPFRQLPVARLSLVIQSDGPPLSLAEPVRAALRQIEPGVQIRDVTTMDRLLSDSVAYPRFRALLVGLLAGLALALALVGLYGVVSYSTGQRVHEMGIRMALGAHTSHIVRLVIGEAARMVFVGVAVGVVSALALARLLTSMLFGVTAADSATLVATAALMLVVALLACYVPARRATKVDPVVALRSE